jgi:hypothetical protein
MSIKTSIVLFLIAIVIVMPNLEYKIKNLETRMAEIEKEKENIGKVLLPVDLDSQKAIELATDNFLKDKIFDLIWKKLFHYFTMFESLDGWDASITGGGSANLDGANLVLTTGAINGNFTHELKRPAIQGLMTFSQKSAFRTSVNLTSVADVTVRIVVGNTGGSYYGFKIVDNTLYGISSNAGLGAENSLALQTLSATNDYHLEARHKPNDAIVFLVDDPTTSPTTSIREVGSISSSLPSAAAVVNDNIFSVKITTNAAAAKAIQLSFMEYLQFRNVLK